ncbi:MAG: hypothetical protein CMF16_08975 [Idiomarina sp.]|nr:hypothetical protein [Idiomarina sp.]
MDKITVIHFLDDFSVLVKWLVTSKLCASSAIMTIFYLLYSCRFQAVYTSEYELSEVQSLVMIIKNDPGEECE